MKPFFIDLTHTAHTRAQTGIQIVCRGFYQYWSADIISRPIIWDRFANIWRDPYPTELSNLNIGADEIPPRSRGSRWSIVQKIRGKWMAFRKVESLPQKATILIMPELFDQRRLEGIKQWNGSVYAVFHDAIALKHPEWTPTETVQKFPDYLAALAQLQGVACVSESAQSDLKSTWESMGIENTPPTKVIRLGLPGVRTTPRAYPDSPKSIHPQILFVGTLERRKNHLALLAACERLWTEGMTFSLNLAGMVNRETGGEALDRIKQIRRAGHPINWLGTVSDNELTRQYAECDLTVYPSLYEGYGLPVLEALAQGKPVLCGNGGALAEFGSIPGCKSIEPSEDQLYQSLKEFIENPDQLRKMKESVPHIRDIPTMDDFSQNLVEWIQSLEK